MQETLLEKVGPNVWIKLRQLVGEPLDRQTIAVMGAAATEGHKIADCVEMLKCSTHKAQWQAHTPAYRRAHRKDHPLPTQRKARSTVSSVSDL